MKVDPTVSKKPRLSKEETAQRLIQTAISMMQTIPISEVSSLKICAAAGLDKMTVRYCFGSHAQLLIAVARHLASGVAPYIKNGIFGIPARQDEMVQLFGRLATFLFASYGSEVPVRLTASTENATIFLVYQQLQDTYGFRADLALLLTKRAVLNAVATSGIGTMLPLSDSEAELFITIQERTYEFLASIQDELQLEK
jgi:AcrR family transcriptional regulator